MMENIRKSIDSVYKMGQPSLNILMGRLEPLKISKKSILIEPFSKNQNVYFIEKGVARAFVSSKSKEITSWLAKEGQLLYSTNSYYGKTKGYESESVQVLEDSILYYLSMEELELLCKENIDIANWLRFFYKKAFLEMERRLIRQLYMSAEDRYKEFIEENKDLLQRVNLGYIASYLGMSHVTLCALRKKQFSLST